jgi:hypothetical protein
LAGLGFEEPPVITNEPEMNPVVAFFFFPPANFVIFKVLQIFSFF